MILRGRKSVTSTVLFILLLVMKVFSIKTLRCDIHEYQNGDKCCRMCSPGSRVKTDCAVSRPTSCFPCSQGTFMNHSTGLKQCSPCADCDQDSGLKTKTSCTTTSDTVCEPLEGFYCVQASDNSCYAAKRHRSCEPGQYISKKGTVSSDTECSDCSNGTLDGPLTSCGPHTQCKTRNHQLVKAGTASADSQCEEKHTTNKSLLTSTRIIAIMAVVLVVVLIITGAAQLLVHLTPDALYCLKKKKECFQLHPVGNPSPRDERTV